MENPVQIVFRHMPPSEAVEATIREGIGGIEKLSDRITRCRVTVEAPSAHAHQGGLYGVRVELDLAAHHITVGRSHHEDHSHEDVHVAVRDALRAARRAMEKELAHRPAPVPAE
jgi:hypothetical protein